MIGRRSKNNATAYCQMNGACLEAAHCVPYLHPLVMSHSIIIISIVVFILYVTVYLHIALHIFCMCFCCVVVIVVLLYFYKYFCVSLLSGYRGGRQRKNCVVQRHFSVRGFNCANDNKHFELTLLTCIVLKYAKRKHFLNCS